MQYTEKQTSAQNFVRSVVEKCWEDTSFKNELIASPVATLEKYTNGSFSIAGDKNLVVTDQTDTTKMYFNIPAKPDFSNMELSDEQLELVAGGEFVVGGTILGVCALAGGIAVGYFFL